MLLNHPGCKDDEAVFVMTNHNSKQLLPHPKNLRAALGAGGSVRLTASDRLGFIIVPSSSITMCPKNLHAVVNESIYERFSYIQLKRVGHGSVHDPSLTKPLRGPSSALHYTK
eukprot:scaffold469_cov160-Amphora_coffeaeformis.AAC.3